MLNISIPEPCHEDWGAMTPTEKGAFCAACSKEVVDFTRMSDDEVKNYFLLNMHNKPCGRFRRSQLKGLNIVVDEQVIYTDIALWKKFLAVVVICFGMFFASCTPGNPTTGAMMPEMTKYTITERSVHDTTADTIKKVREHAACTSKKTGKEIIKGTSAVFAPDDIISGVPLLPPEEVMGKPAFEMPEKEQLKDTVTQAVDSCANPVFL